MNAQPGNFVWYDLMTTDPKAAIKFYSDVVGWTTRPFADNGDESYMLWLASQGAVGGVTTLPDQAKQMGAPPHWMANVQVPDVDAAVARAKELGGQIHVGPMDIPKIGRFAVIADPQGASISAFTPAADMAMHDSAKPGEFGWAEYVGTDHEAAFSFYEQIFGWKKQRDHDMGAMGKYLLFGLGDKELGGMFTKTKEMPMPPSWLYYARVDDLEAAVERAKAGGGKLLHGPMDVPDGSRVAQLMDPQGAAFALLTSNKKKD